MKYLSPFVILLFLFFYSCSTNETLSINENTGSFDISDYVNINLNQLFDYANQSVPNYILKDNTPLNNPITNEGATLGRVLFYDVNLSATNTVSCASCHIQEHAFGDLNQQSQGINGLTPRHSMRLINTRFATESKFFWDERAASLEAQTTNPIRDHVEMGFSGENGDMNFDDLVLKLQNLPYYPVLFSKAFNSETITETRIQNALAQFVRSIQSFDSKYDLGRALVNNDNQPFPSFTPLENQGKDLFNQPPVFNSNGVRINGGVGCAGCHQGPEFDIDPNSLNNGVIGTISGNQTDLSITRSPTLRDIVKQNNESNGGFMHIGISNNLITVIEHYNQINLNGNTNLDPRLRPGGQPQNLNLTENEKLALVAFLRTLSGSDVYVNPKWSSPFYEN